MAKDEIAHIRTERPPSSAAALAARRGPGDRAGMSATRQGSARRRPWDSRPFTGSLPVSAPDGHLVTHGSGAARVRPYRSTVGGAPSGACATLIDPTENALDTRPGHQPRPHVKG